MGMGRLIHVLLILSWSPENISLSLSECGPSSPESCIAAEPFEYGTIGQPKDLSFQYVIPGGFTITQINLNKPRADPVPDVTISLIVPPGDPIIAGPFQGNIEVTDTGTADTRTLTLKILTVADDDEDSYRTVIQYAGNDLFVVGNTIMLAVPVPPDPVLTISGNTDVSAGQSLPLTCTSTQGKPPAQVTWWKGGTEQQQAVYSSSPDDSNQGDAVSVLTLAVQPANNQETYQCRVSQLETELEQQDVQLDVRFMTGAPSLTGYSGPINSGDPLTLTCISGSSNPPASISWTREGGAAPTGTDQPQTDGQHGGKISVQRISLTNLQAQDNGAQFKCTATNSQLAQNPSLDSSVVTANVRFYLDGSSITGYSGPVTSGDPLTLTCTSGSSNPPAAITWSREGGEAITGTDQPQTDGQHGGKITSQQIRLTNLQAQDNGAQFKCTVTNSDVSRTEEETVTIVVQYAPTNVHVTCNPNDLSDLREGGALVCTCTADSNPAAQYSWTKDSTAGPLPTGAVVDSTVGTLTFSTLDRTHSGEYNCTANNGISPEATGGGVTVDVKYPASITSITPFMTVDEYDDVSLTCTADSNPAPGPDNFSWTYMNVISLQGDLSNQGLTLITTITTITYQQAGTYTCTAGNGIGTSASAETSVTVEYPPKFYPPPDPYPAAIGADVSMQCSGFAVPNKISFTWSKDGATLTNSSRITIQSLGGTSVLSISDVVEGDYGTYNCEATNVKGSATTTRTLQAEGPPSSPTGLTVVSKNTEFEVRIIWTAGFNGGLDTTHTVQLTKAGADRWGDVGSWEQTASQQRSTFNVTLDLKLQEAGDYQIRIMASNEQGEAWSDDVDLKLEDVNQRLYGRMTRDDDWLEALKNSESPEFRENAALWERNLDKVFSTMIGYEGSTITQFSQGSVVGDFEAVVAQSETQAAIEAFRTQVNFSGSVGDLTVVKEGSAISEQPPPVGGTNTTVIIIAVTVVVCGVVLLAIIIVTVMVVKRRKSSNNKPAQNHSNNMALDHVRGEADDGYESLRIPHRRTSDHTYQGLTARSDNEITSDGTYEDVKSPSEFPRNQLDIKEQLGHGEFGSVFKAEAWKISGRSGISIVAAKELKGMTIPAASTAFFKELAVLKQIGTHPNVVSFLGCCTDTEPFYLLLEFVSGGSLQSTLRTSRIQQTYGNLHGGSKSLSSRDLTKFAWDVAKGMSFLSAKKILHRDLATRNVLVSEDKTCKVSDFGFSREGDEYERTTKTRLPIRWMAPESLFHRKYTIKSDVWAFGVLLWEIVTLGATPYPGMSKREVMDGVQQGYRMDKPHHCDGKLYSLMLSCWEADPVRRPEFRKIQRTLDTLMEAEHDYINLASLDENTYTSLQNATDEKY